VDKSSISPIVSREVSSELAKKQVIMLDAPVSGGEPKAIDGSLAIMVGGPEDAFAKVEKILAVMGGSVTLVGEIGSGNITKLANQIRVAANIAGMSEALVLATKAKVDPEKVFKAIRGGLAGSTVLDAKAPLVLAGNFKPGFRIDLHIKDLQNVLDTAKSVETPSPISEAAITMMKSLSSEGKGSDDHGGLIQWYEKQAKVEVRS
jgi:2-hydroxy-3-oxopropionate reductase